MLKERDQSLEKQDCISSMGEGTETSIFLNKSLSAALDSFDNLFCRRCLVCIIALCVIVHISIEIV